MSSRTRKLSLAANESLTIGVAGRLCRILASTGTVVVAARTNIAGQGVKELGEAELSAGKAGRWPEPFTQLTFEDTSGAPNAIEYSAGLVEVEDQEISGFVTINGAVDVSDRAARELGQVDVLASSAIGAAQVTVNTSEVTVRSADPTQKSVCVKAASSNTGVVYVGPTGVTTATGFALAAGESVTFNTTAIIRARGSAAGQKVFVAWETQ